MNHVLNFLGSDAAVISMTVYVVLISGYLLILLYSNDAVRSDLKAALRRNLQLAEMQREAEDRDISYRREVYAKAEKIQELEAELTVLKAQTTQHRMSSGFNSERLDSLRQDCIELNDACNRLNDENDKLVFELKGLNAALVEAYGGDRAAAIRAVLGEFPKAEVIYSD